MNAIETKKHRQIVQIKDSLMNGKIINSNKLCSVFTKFNTKKNCDSTQINRFESQN